MASHITKAARKRSIQRIKKAYANKTLGAMYMGECTYSGRGGKTCIVGAMFNEAQLADIKRRRLNTKTDIYTLGDVIGRDNIEAVTGFELSELKDMQEEHDAAVHTGNMYANDRLKMMIENLK